MKKVFVAAAIIAMFAAVSCKNEKKAEAPAEEPQKECCEGKQCEKEGVASQLENKAEEAAVQVGSAAIDAAADKVIEKL